MGRVILCTVGTSVIGLDKHVLAGAELDELRRRLGTQLPTATVAEVSSNPGFSGYLARAASTLRYNWRHLQTSLHSEAPPVQLEGAREKLPAEACGLAALRVEPDDTVVLIHSDSSDGAFSAACLQTLLDGEGIARCRCTDDVAPPDRLVAEGGVRRVAGLNARSPRDFEALGLPNLVNAILELQEACRGQRLIIDVTGGYKPQSLYSALVGLLTGVDVFFLHQDSAGDSIKLQRLPIEFDLLDWHENQLFLNLIPTLPRHSTEPYLNLLPEALKLCFEARSGCGEPQHSPGIHYCWKPLGRALRIRYENEYRIERHTSGQQVLELVTDPSLREKLLKRMERRHLYLWEGDKLPEAVGHGRSHAQNLLNVAVQILVQVNAFGGQPLLSPYEAYLLINAIWLHDIGQAGGSLFLRRCPDEGLWEPADGEADAHEVHLTNPRLVRQAHHLLTYERIRKHSGPLGFESFDAEARLIAEICRHHPRGMPLKETDSPFVGNLYGYVVRLNASLAATAPPGLPVEDRIRPRLMSALLRLIDVCDTQKVRTGEDVFKRLRFPLTVQDQRAAEYRKQGLEHAVMALAAGCRKDLDLSGECWKEVLVAFRLKSELPADEQALLDALVAYWDEHDAAVFRAEQPAHFEKHEQVERVSVAYAGTSDGCHSLIIRVVPVKGADPTRLGEAKADIEADYESVRYILKEAGLDFAVQLETPA